MGTLLNKILQLENCLNSLCTGWDQTGTQVGVCGYTYVLYGTYTGFNSREQGTLPFLYTQYPRLSYWLLLHHTYLHLGAVVNPLLHTILSHLGQSTARFTHLVISHVSAEYIGRMLQLKTFFSIIIPHQLFKLNKVGVYEI